MKISIPQYECSVERQALFQSNLKTMVRSTTTTGRGSTQLHVHLAAPLGVSPIAVDCPPPNQFHLHVETEKVELKMPMISL